MDFAALIQSEISKKKSGTASPDYGYTATASKTPQTQTESSDDLKRLERLKQMKRQRDLDREEEQQEKRARIEEEEEKKKVAKVDSKGVTQSAVEAPQLSVAEQAEKDAKTNVWIEWGDVATQKDATRDTETKHKLTTQLRVFLARLLSEWEGTLEKKEGKEGDVADTIFAETQSSLSSLMVLLRNNALQDEVLAMLSKVMYHVQHEEHHQAYDVYLKLCIGNACWPVGVASIGIHARASQNKTIASARNSKQVAHIVNDDTRQWLVCIKRLLTFAEGCVEEVRRAMKTVVDEGNNEVVSEVNESKEAASEEKEVETKEVAEEITSETAVAPST